MTKRTIIFTLLASLATVLLLRNPLMRLQASASQEQAGASVGRLPGLSQHVTVVRDTHGVPHISASNDHDVYFMMGYMHAQDRFFQMDVLRRQGGGTLAELLGAGPRDQILRSDVQNRVLGINRSAERSMSVYSPEAVALIQAYSDGVNAWVDSNPLPPEYTLLEVTKAPRWRPVDSVTIVKLIQFQQSFDTSDAARTETLLGYQAAGQAGGFDGTKLYFEDIFRFSPFDPAVTVPGQSNLAAVSSGGIQSLNLQSQRIQSLNLQSQMSENALQANQLFSPDVRAAARDFVEQYKQNPFLNLAELGVGSNWWVVAGSKTTTGNAMLASDPHLSLGTPSNLYEIHLTVDSHSSPMNVYGASFAGVPGVFLGQNESISWGASVAALDVTDIYAEKLVSQNGVPVATRYKGGIEPLVAINETFKANQIQNGATDDIVVITPGNRPSGLTVPPVTLVVPRRNNGGLVPNSLTDAFSIQITCASATRDLEGIFALARARNLSDFKRGLQFLDAGSENWAYADVDGNIATFVNGKVPLREDLQAGTVEGLAPFFIRDGTGTVRNEWIPRSGDQPGFKYESLPFDEMPHAINPEQGFLVNANNDPIGVTLDNDLLNKFRRDGGIYYISSGFNPGFRAAKITSLLNQQFRSRHGHGKVSFQDMQRIQRNVQMFDAEVFTPYIIRAFNAARSAGAPAELAALANDPAVSEAVERLARWDYSAPTGIPEGYDASDINGVRQSPSNHEISNSVAATIYTVWRSQIMLNTISATLERVGLGEGQPVGNQMLVDLRFLLDNFSTNHGRGASGLDFFEIPGVDAPPEIRRDAIILQTVKIALNLLASDIFADAFERSTNQNDYRWGKLHRITFSHVFGGLAPQLSIPTAGAFENLSPTLPGLATDGAFETIDNGPFNSQAASSQAYVFGGGPARRYVSELRCGGIQALQIIPGGESGVPGSRFYADQLSLWLTNDYHRVLFTDAEINSHQYSRVIYQPAH